MLYHFTHVDNLSNILSAGHLISDNAIRSNGSVAVECGDVEVKAFRPLGAPESSAMPNATERPAMTLERAAFIAALSRYIRNGLSSGLAVESHVSLLEAHKIAYFLQKLRIPLRLRFDKGIYGPYAPALDRAIASMEGHFIVGFGDGTNGARASLRVADDAVDEAESILQPSRNFRAAALRFDALAARFEDAFGMELLSTVMFAADELVEPPPTAAKAATYIQNWNARKRRLFTDDRVNTAWDRLREVELV